MNVRVIAHGSPEYQQAVELRRVVLRLPLGLDFSREDLAAESGDVHLAAFEETTLVGCLSLVTLADSTLKMRQVAVDPQWQGKGVGRELVAFSETLAADCGARQIVLHARESAVPFYERLGYLVMEAPFTEVGIPHRKMVKELSPTAC